MHGDNNVVLGCVHECSHIKSCSEERLLGSFLRYMLLCQFKCIVNSFSQL